MDDWLLTSREVKEKGVLDWLSLLSGPEIGQADLLVLVEFDDLGDLMEADPLGRTGPRLRFRTRLASLRLGTFAGLDIVSIVRLRRGTVPIFEHIPVLFVPMPLPALILASLAGHLVAEPVAFEDPFVHLSFHLGALPCDGGVVFVPERIRIWSVDRDWVRNGGTDGDVDRDRDFDRNRDGVWLSSATFVVDPHRDGTRARRRRGDVNWHRLDPQLVR